MNVNDTGNNNNKSNNKKTGFRETDRFKWLMISILGIVVIIGAIIYPNIQLLQLQRTVIEQNDNIISNSDRMSSKFASDNDKILKDLQTLKNANSDNITIHKDILKAIHANTEILTKIVKLLAQSKSGIQPLNVSS